MNKLLVFILLISNVGWTQNQASCKKGAQRANEDFNNQKYTLQTLGQIVDPDFDPFLVAYAQQKYNIKMTLSSCMVSPESDCYVQTMRDKVFAKFGPGIEDRIQAEALVAFKNSDKYLTEIQPKLDSGLVFGRYYKSAQFPGDNDGWRSFWCNNIKDTKHSYWTAYFTFVVEADGSVSNLTFTKKVNPEAQAEIERLFAMMEKWTPATVYGEKIRSKVSHSISSKKSLEMTDDAKVKSRLEFDDKKRTAP
ncbi:hypothetical protein [Flavobacterium sp.]|uniref:hypothetical protein n=1 Tax=Flavobacterium sp. TaxID=239 RepID=UPI0039E43EF0